MGDAIITVIVLGAMLVIIDGVLTGLDTRRRGMGLAVRVSLVALGLIVTPLVSPFMFFESVLPALIWLFCVSGLILAAGTATGSARRSLPFLRVFWVSSFAGCALWILIALTTFPLD